MKNMAKFTCPFCIREYDKSKVLYVCPDCGDDDLIELEIKCSHCNEFITDDYIRTEDDNVYCYDCIDHIAASDEEFTCSCCEETFSHGERYNASDGPVYCPDCVSERSIF